MNHFDYLSQQQFLLRSMFLRPNYIGDIDWLEHVPLAFWLTEAHRPSVVVEVGVQGGTSYFAFCQAIRALNLPTISFAIIKEDSCSKYGEVISQHDDIVAYNNSEYSDFSRIVYATEPAALENFPDGAIDLVHLRAPLSNRSSRIDMDNWIKKLSPTGIIIANLPNAKDRDFGLYKMLEELQDEFSTFEFPNSTGLIVVASGAVQNPFLKELFSSDRDLLLRKTVQDLFTRLGQSCIANPSRRHQQATAEISSPVLSITDASVESSTPSSVEKEVKNVKASELNQNAVGLVVGSEDRLTYLKKYNQQLRSTVEELRAELERERAAINEALEIGRRDQEFLAGKLMTLQAEREELITSGEAKDRKLAACFEEIAALSAMIKIQPTAR